MQLPPRMDLSGIADDPDVPDIDIVVEVASAIEPASKVVGVGAASHINSPTEFSTHCNARPSGDWALAPSLEQPSY